MNMTHRAAAVSAVVIVLGVIVSALHAQPKPPVYAVIDISEVADADAYIKAVSAAEPNATRSAGGRFIVRASKPIALDGTPPDRFVIIAFESEERAKAWYASEAIRNVNAVRMKVTKSRAFLVNTVPN